MTTRHISTFIVTLLLAGLSVDSGAWGSANRFGGSSSYERGEGGEHSNRWGGSTEHAEGGGTEHSNAWGGSTEGRAGEGAEHTNPYGGSTEARYGSGAEHTNMYGGTTAGAYGDGAYHTTAYGATAYRPPTYGTYPAYHPPVAVPYYSSGCAGCAVAAGAVVGMAAGAAVASANTASAYNAGVAAGVTAASAPMAPAVAVAAPRSYPMGYSYASLPPGASQVNVRGTTYYLSGNTWFQPFFGANGAYYQVVSAP